jgi:tRNA (guanine37-N1)-methyltransferase
MRIDVISIFPEMFDVVINAGITSRAHETGLWSLHRWNPRDFTSDTYRRVDDRPYGGGPGMVMLAKPLNDTLDAVQVDQQQASKSAGPVIVMSPHGQPLTHDRVREWSSLSSLTVVAGRYEAIDQRFIDARVDAQVCVGDFVVSGGELPAMMLIDALVRLLPGAVNDAQSIEQESFVNGLLDCPHYTRPETLGDAGVPPVLLSGDHAKIEQWRREQALLLTARERPDLIASLRERGGLSPEDLKILNRAK